MMRVIADLCLIPIGVGVSVSREIAACERVLAEAGLKTKLHAYGTNIEGEWDEVMALIKACVMKVAEHAPRVDLVMKVDYRPGITGALRGKVEAIEERLKGV